MKHDRDSSAAISKALQEMSPEQQTRPVGGLWYPKSMVTVFLKDKSCPGSE
jgi:hypothetical protein